MKYAIFSDIHGNLEALHTVWATLERGGLTGQPVLNAGDTVGYGADPEACVRFLQAHPACVSVKGNYDKNVALFPERNAEYRRKWGQSRPEKYAALREDSAAISDSVRQWLLHLPAEAEVVLQETPVFLTHYAPGSKEGLGAWTPDTRLAELAVRTEASVVVCGHTHTPFVRNVGGVLWVNPGSLGRDWEGRWCYAILTLEPGRLPAAELRDASRGH